jgi:CARDB protein
MLSSGRLSLRAFHLLLASGLVGGCGEVTSLEVRSPGGDNALQADLTPGPIEAPDHLLLDALLQMRVGVSNSGNLTAGPGWVVRVFVSGDPQIEPSDRQIDQFVTTRELRPGSQDTYLRNKKLSGLGPGEYYVGSIVDVTQVVPELSETNNALASPGRITLLPEAPAP